MKLSDAIEGNAPRLAEAQNAYKENVAVVNTYTAAIVKTELPTLTKNPPEWDAFEAAFLQGKKGALSWDNTVMGDLLSVPGEVEEHDKVVSQALAAAKAQAEILVSEPSNEVALAALQSDLKTIENQVGLVTDFVSSAYQAIKKFEDQLPTLAASLQQVATKSAQAAGADEKLIAELEESVTRLRADIKSLTAALIGYGIADAAALTLAGLAVLAAGPIGMVTWLFLAPVVAFATTEIVLSAKQLEKDKQEIKEDEDKISGLTADVAALKLFAGHYEAMVSETATIETSLGVLLAAWQQLEGDLNAAISDINKAMGDATKHAFQTVVGDLDEAVTEWGKAMADASGLSLDLQMSSATLTIGMSQEEIAAALAAGTTVPLRQFYNHAREALAAA